LAKRLDIGKPDGIQCFRRNGKKPALPVRQDNRNTHAHIRTGAGDKLGYIRDQTHAGHCKG
jgi:hypothetical protein